MLKKIVFKAYFRLKSNISLQPINTISNNRASFNTLGKNITIFKTINSTNSYAIDKVQKKLAKHGDVFLALDQNEGRGQRGRKWVSSAGKNLMFTIVLDMRSINITDKFSLVAAISVAITKYIYNTLGICPSIKWPNDIYIHDKKAAGILIENLIRGSIWNWAIVGIGINVNQTEFGPLLPNAISLKTASGKEFDLLIALREIIALIDHYFNLSLINKNAQVLKTYNSYLYKKGDKVRLLIENKNVECIIKGVNENGLIHVEGTGIKQYYGTGDVEWVL